MKKPAFTVSLIIYALVQVALVNVLWYIAIKTIVKAIRGH